MPMTNGDEPQGDSIGVSKDTEEERSRPWMLVEKRPKHGG